MKLVQKVLLFWLVSVFLFLNLGATLRFDNSTSAFVLKDTKSKIRLNPSTVQGWQDQSIVKNITGIGQGDYNLRNYGTNGSNLISGGGLGLALGNLSIAANQSIHITGNTAIDGHGNTLDIGENSQLFVDADVTLTLRNIIIKNNKNQPGNPPIKLATQGSKLVLDNSTLNLADDFYFDRGQLFVYNDVNINGTSSFLYRSASASFIKSGANLKFNSGTTLDYRPSTTGTPSLLAKDLFIMENINSRITLNGATLKTTLTGMRLTKGQLLFDNNVSLTSASSLRISGTSAVIQTAATGRAFVEVDTLQWSPDGRLVAVAGKTRTNPQTANLAVYKFDGASTTTLATADFSITASGLSWSSDGKYLAAGGKVQLPLSTTLSTSSVRVYSLVNNTLSLVASEDFGTYAGPVSWSPDGRYLAVGGNCRNIVIYEFNGQTLNQTDSKTSAEVLGISWHPSGRYLAISTNSATNSLAVYTFANGVLGTSPVTRNYTSFGSNVAWSPDGNFLAATAQNSSKDVLVYAFNPISFLLDEMASTDFGTNARVVKWSSDGRFILVGGNNGARDLVLYLAFTGTSLVALKIVSYGTSIYSCDGSPNGRYLAVGGVTPNASNMEFEIGVFSYGPELTAQAISNSIVFGNSAAGSASDLKVQLLSGANVEVNGILNYDNINSTSIFSCDNSRFVLKDSNAKMRVNPGTLIGWRDRSLIKNEIGVGQSDYNLRSYSGADKVVLFTEAPGELVYNNSNAINYWSPINRTTSNFANYWGPINRGTSNATSWLSTRVRSDSNAFVYGIKNNSNAIVTLNATTGTLSLNNSNSVKFLADHFVTVNDAKFYIINGISGSTTLNGRSILASPIDLQGGTLTLNGDMILSSQTTIPSSGNFALNGYAMLLGGDLIIPDSVGIKVASSGIIDGQGNNLEINTLGKISVDNNVTLTLRNINILGHGSLPIEMRTNNSTLALENVATLFDRDFTFSQGKLFIHDDVVVTGSNKFSYASTATAYISSHSLLCFDKNTTFSYSPRLAGRHTLSERNLIKLADKTSGIYFDGCTLQLPDSGWRLTKGTIYFDNRVTVNAPATQEQSFEWGDGIAADNLDVGLLAGATVDAIGYVYDNEV